mmetsp:Transcript_3894/g.9502  ORF Transcript_3894/g.9502 Transcript_3894/m.9502 type:complete len:419 (-) Transcript_3894:554-1810(-)
MLSLSSAAASDAFAAAAVPLGSASFPLASAAFPLASAALSLASTAFSLASAELPPSSAAPRLRLSGAALAAATPCVRAFAAFLPRAAAARSATDAGSCFSSTAAARIALLEGFTSRRSFFVCSGMYSSHLEFHPEKRTFTAFKTLVPRLYHTSTTLAVHHSSRTSRANTASPAATVSPLCTTTVPAGAGGSSPPEAVALPAPSPPAAGAAAKPDAPRFFAIVFLRRVRIRCSLSTLSKDAFVLPVRRGAASAEAPFHPGVAPSFAALVALDALSSSSSAPAATLAEASGFPLGAEARSLLAPCLLAPSLPSVAPFALWGFASFPGTPRRSLSLVTGGVSSASPSSAFESLARASPLPRSLAEDCFARGLDSFVLGLGAALRADEVAVALLAFAPSGSTLDTRPDSTSTHSSHLAFHPS